MENSFDYKLNDLSNIDEIISISKDVFHPSEESILKYHNKEDWLNKIKNKGLLISVYDNDVCIAYALCNKIDDDILRIWNVGVLDEYRGLGIWNQIYNMIVNYAVQEGYKKLNLNTFKVKFPNMYKFVKKEGFNLMKEETKDDGYTKSYFIKDIVQ